MKRALQLAAFVGIWIPLLLWLALVSPPGRSFVRRRLESAVNRRIQGKLEISSVAIGPGPAIRLDGVKLLAPDGSPAVEAASIRTWLLPRRGRPLVLLQLDRPVLDLTPDAAGRTRLDSALAARGPPRAAPANATHPRRTLPVDVAALVRGAAIRRGAVRIDDLSVAARLGRERMSVQATARTSGRTAGLLAALDDPLGSPSLDTLRVVVGDSVLAADDLSLGDPPSGSLLASLAPADLALLTGRRARTRIELRAGLSPAGDGTRATLQAWDQEGGRVEADAVRRRDRSVTGRVQATHLSPSGWGAPAVAELRTIDLDASGERAADGSIHALARSLQLGTSEGIWSLSRPSTVTHRTGTTTVRGLDLQGPRSQSLWVDGTWPPRADAPLRAGSRHFEVHGLPATLVPSLRGLAGFLDLDLTLTALPLRGSPPRGEAKVALREGSWKRYGPVDLDLAGRLAPAGFRLHLLARGWKGASLRLTASGPLHPPGPGDRPRITAHLAGVSEGDLKNAGLDLSLGEDQGRSWLLARGVAQGKDVLDAALTTQVDWGIARKGNSLAALERRPPPGVLALRRLDLSTLAAAGLLAKSAEGIVSGVVASRGGALHANLSVLGARVGSSASSDLALSVHAAYQRAVLSLSARLRSGGQGALGGWVAGLRTSRPTWALRGAMTDLAFREISGQSETPPDLSSLPAVTGRIDSALAFQGQGRRPIGWLYAGSRDLDAKGHPVGRFLLAGHLTETAVSAWAEGARGRGRLATVALLAGDPLQLIRGGKWKTANAAAFVDADQWPLDPLAPFLAGRGVRRVGGVFTGRAVARGPIQSVRPRAHLSVENGELDWTVLGPIHAIAVDLSFQPDRLELRNLSARAGSGNLSAQGAANRSGSRWSIQGNADARRFGIAGNLFAGILDGKANLRGELGAPSLAAEVQISSGQIQLPSQSSRKVQSLSPEPDFVIAGTGPAIKRVSGSAPVTPFTTRIHVVAPDNLWVKGQDVNVELKADLTVVSAEETRIDGTVETLRGEVAVAGKKFTLDQAEVTFPGAAPGDAHLDVHATHVMDDPEQTKVYAIVGGTVDRPDVQLTSDPPLPQDSVASLLFLGATDPRNNPSGAQPSLAGRAATLVGNYLTQQVRDQLVHVVPLDVLELETGGPTSAAQGRVRLGKYVGPGLFLSYSHAFGAGAEEALNVVQLDYRFARDWKVTGQYDDAARGTVDLLWTRDF